MSATPMNPHGRGNPQRRDDWDDGFAAGSYELAAWQSQAEKYRARLAEVETLALRYYHADGTFSVMASSEACVEERKRAAVRLAEVEAKRHHETQHLLDCCAARDKALAASQAEVARLREALDTIQMHTLMRDDERSPYIWVNRTEFEQAIAALASAPGSTDALREVCERAWRAGSLHGMGGCNPTDGPPWTEADDKRMAAEVANILGERGKEGGDA